MTPTSLLTPTQRAEALLAKMSGQGIAVPSLLSEAASIIRDLLAEREWRPTHRHLKRGSEYQVLAFGELQTTSPIPDETPVTIYLAGNGAHSEKPQAFFDLVERLSPSPRLEMFARAPREGWSVFGNEADGDVAAPKSPSREVLKTAVATGGGRGR